LGINLRNLQSKLLFRDYDAKEFNDSFLIHCGESHFGLFQFCFSLLKYKEQHNNEIQIEINEDLFVRKPGQFLIVLLTIKQSPRCSDDFHFFPKALKKTHLIYDSLVVNCMLLLINIGLFPPLVEG